MIFFPKSNGLGLISNTCCKSHIQKISMLIHIIVLAFSSTDIGLKFQEEIY